jgi:hypothetical protein
LIPKLRLARHWTVAKLGNLAKPERRIEWFG